MHGGLPQDLQDRDEREDLQPHLQGLQETSRETVSPTSSNWSPYMARDVNQLYMLWNNGTLVFLVTKATLELADFG